MSAPGGLLALHLHPLIGAWAYGCPTDKPDHGTWRWPLTSDDGELGAALFDALAGAVKVNQPDMIIVTAPFIDDVDSQARAKLAITTMGLTVCAKVYAYRRKLRLAVAGIEDMQRTLFNRPLKTKEADDVAITYCRTRRGWPVLTAAPAHALVLWAYGLEIGLRK